MFLELIFKDCILFVSMVKKICILWEYSVTSMSDSRLVDRMLHLNTLWDISAFVFSKFFGSLAQNTGCLICLCLYVYQKKKKLSM